LRSGPSRRHRHLAPATRNWPPGIGCTVICDSARSAIGVTAARSGACTVIRAATGRAAAGSGKHAPAAENAMMTDPQDRKAHHLISPYPVTVPPLFSPVTHSDPWR
jgi:hypothetical protein